MSTRTRPVALVIDDQPMEGEYRSERQWIEVSTERAFKPDPSWTFVDVRGHYHAWAATGEKRRDLPTLTARSIPVPCDGSCGGVCGGEGTFRDEYRCSLCEEVIKPGYVPDNGSKSIPGLETHEVVVYGLVAEGRRVSVRVEFGDTVLFGFGDVMSTDVTDNVTGPTFRTYLTCGPLTRQLDRPKVGAR